MTRKRGIGGFETCLTKLVALIACRPCLRSEDDGEVLKNRFSRDIICEWPLYYLEILIIQPKCFEKSSRGKHINFSSKIHKNL